MAAAQSYGLVFVGQSGRTYSVSGYTADTAAYTNRFSVSGAAGAATSEYIKFPEAVTLVDFSMTTGTTQTAMILTESGAPRNGTLLMFVPHLSTNSNRPRLNIPFSAGAMIGAQTI
jgi:hypothetical protein